MGYAEGERGLYSILESRDIIVLDFQDDSVKHQPNKDYIIPSIYDFLLRSGALQNPSQKYFVYDFSKLKLVQLKDEEDIRRLGLGRKVMSQRSLEDNAKLFLKNIQENISGESERILQSAKRTVLCNYCPSGLMDDLKTLHEGLKWNVVLLLAHKYFASSLYKQKSLDWIPYHMVFFVNFDIVLKNALNRYIVFLMQQQTEMWIDIYGVLKNPSYNHFTHFDQHEEKITCSKKIGIALYHFNIFCVSKLIYLLRSRMDVQIFLYGRFFSINKVNILNILNFYKQSINYILFGITDQNDILVNLNMDGWDNRYGAFKCYGQNFEFVENIMADCRRLKKREL